MEGRPAQPTILEKQLPTKKAGTSINQFPCQVLEISSERDQSTYSQTQLLEHTTATEPQGTNLEDLPIPNFFDIGFSQHFGAVPRLADSNTLCCDIPRLLPLRV